MNVCLVLVGIALTCNTAAPEPARSPATVAATAAAAAVSWPTRPAGPPAEDDAWVGEDKLQHLGLAFAATAMTYGTARTALEPAPSRLAAGATAAIVSVGKEWLDRRRTGLFSYRDLAWDVAGITAGLLLAGEIR